MPRISIGFGITLIIAGFIGWFATDFASFTALIPAAIGVLLIISGYVATKRPRLGGHLGQVIALLGLIGTFMNVTKIGQLFDGTAERPAAIILSVVTFILLLVYLIIGIRSFVKARSAKGATSTS